jgi:glyoxylate reductase
MTLPRVFVTHRLTGPLMKRIEAAACVDCFSGQRPPSREELTRGALFADGLLCLLTDRVDEDLLRAAPKLAVISSVSVGLDHIDVAAATERGIPVGHTPFVLVETTADFTFALLLAAARRVVEADGFVRDGSWTPDNRWSPTMLLGRDVHGAVLGVVGLGQIGQAVARRAQGFGMRVLGYNRTPRAVPHVESVPLDELCALSDYVSVHVALTEQTRGLIDARAIARMKPGAILINTARGGIVDEAALALAIREGRLGGAGLDVFASEPLGNESLLAQLREVVLAPHIGSASVATRARMAELAVNNLLAGLRGERMQHCANPAVYDRSCR